jgi:hypothetical protein
MINYESMRGSAYNRLDMAVNKYIDNPDENNYRYIELLLESFHAIVLGSAEQQALEVSKAEVEA